MSKTFRFVDHLIEKSVSCTDNAERLIARFEQTGDERFLDLANQYTEIAAQYRASADNILQAIKSTRTTAK